MKSALACISVGLRQPGWLLLPPGSWIGVRVFFAAQLPSERRSQLLLLTLVGRDLVDLSGQSQGLAEAVLSNLALTLFLAHSSAVIPETWRR